MTFGNLKTKMPKLQPKVSPAGTITVASKRLPVAELKVPVIQNVPCQFKTVFDISALTLVTT